MRFATLALLAFAGLAGAARNAVAHSHRIVIEVNVPGTIAYSTVLNNVENLKKAFAPDPVQVEVVCHGAGIDMLIAKNPAFGKRIARVSRLGVDFCACGNTVRGRHIDRKSLYRFVHVVDSGVAEVVRKQEAGWSYLKGAF